MIDQNLGTSALISLSISIDWSNSDSSDLGASALISFSIFIDWSNSDSSDPDPCTIFLAPFLFFKKAFDTVSHNILLDKLNHYGFRGIINDWFSSYLNNRMQSTQIGPYISNKASVSYGIPQGSVLGPLLFLLYVNDIHQCSNKLKFYLFADDTNILYADKKLKSLENIVNIELQNLHEWLTSNKLTLNTTKTNFVIFHPYQKKSHLPTEPLHVR